MKIKLELDMPEIKTLGFILKTVDPMNIFTAGLFAKISQAVSKPEEENKEQE